jgi:hypothetical protein
LDRKSEGGESRRTDFRIASRDDVDSFEEVNAFRQFVRVVVMQCGPKRWDQMAIQGPDMGKDNSYVCGPDDGAEPKVGVGKSDTGRPIVCLLVQVDNGVSEDHGH